MVNKLTSNVNKDKGEREFV